MAKIFKEFFMSQSAIDKPLKTFFEPKTLSELGVMGHILVPAVRFEDTRLPKKGLAKWLSYLPKISKEPIVMDIDVGCVLLGQTGNIIDKVYYGNIRSDNDGVRHGGDALIGAINFDDKFINQEQIHLHLNKIHDDVHHIFIVIGSYHKQSLTLANKGLGILRDNEGALIHEFELASLDKDTHAVIAWHIKRNDDDWSVRAPLKAIGHDSMENLLTQTSEFLSAQTRR